MGRVNEKEHKHLSNEKPRFEMFLVLKAPVFD